MEGPFGCLAPSLRELSFCFGKKAERLTKGNGTAPSRNKNNYKIKGHFKVKMK